MKNQFETPILFLIFNRPETTLQVFNQIRKIKPDKLFIAADGPRKEKEGESAKCEETRSIINQIDWECEVKTLFRDKNLGCGIAVSSAISWFFNQVEYGIILEDDCLPSISFFSYCEELLIKYKDDEKIMMIGGNNFQNGIKRGIGSYYFSRYPHIWGWASWKRAWSKYDFEMHGLNLFCKNGINEVFSCSSERNYWERLLHNVKKGKINTWDHQWVYSIWKNNGIAITPNHNLVLNIGMNSTSTHIFLKDSLKEINEFTEIKFPLVHPEINIDLEADRTTFNNVFSHNFSRLFRLFRENKTLDIIKLFKNRWFQS